MAADFIGFPKTGRTVLASQIIRAANDTIDLCDRIRAINDAAGHMFDGGDYSVFIAQTNVASGQAANLITLLGLMNTIFNTATDVPGANRATQLGEFKARLGGQ